MTKSSLVYASIYETQPATGEALAEDCTALVVFGATPWDCARSSYAEGNVLYRLKLLSGPFKVPETGYPSIVEPANDPEMPDANTVRWAQPWSGVARLRHGAHCPGQHAGLVCGLPGAAEHRGSLAGRYVARHEHGEPVQRVFVAADAGRLPFRHITGDRHEQHVQLGRTRSRCGAPSRDASLWTRNRALRRLV